MKLDKLQQAIYTKLTGNTALMALAEAVWSPKAPQQDDGELAGPFPYIVIPQMNASPFDTKTSNGGSVVVQVDGYLRSKSELDAHALQGRLYDALHKQPLSITGATWIDTLHEGTTYGYEDNGKTRRFVSLYRVTYQINS